MVTNPAAPGLLELVREFVNTVDLESMEDEISSPSALGRWLAERGLLPVRASVSAEELGRARAVREALRALLVANNGGEGEHVATHVLDEAADRARMTLRFGPEGVVFHEPVAGGVDGALGRLLEIVAGAAGDGTWSRLKACRAHGCRWVFYDGARNRSRCWCSMAVCGNRSKARSYRARRLRERAST